MKSDEFFELLEHMDEKIVEEAASFHNSGKRRRFMLFAAVATCLVLVCAIRLIRIEREEKMKTQGVTIAYTNDPVVTESKSELVYLTEEEIFTKFDLLIFKGTVTGIQNLRLDFAGDTEYRAVAQIQIERVYHGSGSAGEIITVLLPCPITTGVMVEDTDVISSVKVGMRGIFMPVVYTDDSRWEQNGAILFLKDLADYGFLDGHRYAFLETDKGLLFARETFPDIAQPRGLEEAEEYIIQMTGKYQ